MEKHFTVKQLAAATGFSADFIRDLVQAKKLAHYRATPRGPIHIAQTDWDRCLARLRVDEDGGEKRMVYRSVGKRRRHADVSDLPGHDTYAH
jgi:hypothetical protein